MICPSCAHENRAAAKFCEECAAPLRRACASCGSELRPTAKFCDECAAPAPGSAPAARPAAAAGARKIVTIVFADLVGSTALHERLDPESVRQFMESYYQAMRGAVTAHGGRVTQLLGDGVKAVFGAPRVAEDDAIRAVRAAVEMQRAFRQLAEEQSGRVGKTGLRVAVNTGEVVANDETEIIGDPVNVAARLQEQGRDGDVVIGESTHRLVAALVTLDLLGSFALKGRSEAVKAYRVVSLERPAGAAAAPFVGRNQELARLEAVYRTAVEKPGAGLAVLVGSPGLGKSRLIDEFARQHADAAIVVTAHCDAAAGATFAPLTGALRELLGIDAGATSDALGAAVEGALPADDAADRGRIAGGITALLSGSPASPEETFFVVRRLLGALARHKPVMLVIDDLQWAEPLLLDLVEHLIQWGSGVPLLVLIGARPELRDRRSSLLVPGGLVADVITLAGLDAGAAMRLAANVIGAADLPAAVAAKVLATSEGNPLFVGELVRMLVQEGALTKEGERWTTGAGLAALEMPPTIHALLAARIERLHPEECRVLEHAAVVGRHFSRSAVAALLPGDDGDLDARLEALRRGELIEPDTGWLLGEPVLRFHHVLIRDAAYRRLLKGTRAELHARLADWIETRVGDAAEHDETLGWHLEQAHRHLRELGPIDATGRALGERASTYLAAAGRRALARDDVPLAANFLGRALDRLDADDPARADLALDWCEALLAAGDVGPAAAAIDELGRFVHDSDRLRAWHTCFAGQLTVLNAPEALEATADAVAAAATSLAAQGDAAGEAKAHFVYALALARLGKVGACEAALDQALAAARRAGDRRRANTVLAIAPLAALWGPSPVTRASGRCLDVVRVLRITQGAPAAEAVALSCQGVLEALRGRTDAARRMIASARKMVEELGITQRLLEVDVFAGLVELLEGDAPAAERDLRRAYDGLRELGLGIDAAWAAALLARARLAQDRPADAEALSHESEALAGDDLKGAIAWRGVRAEALARRGEHAAAVALASKAVEIAAATDALLDHADARLALAAALRAAGRSREADDEERRASELWETKGATLLGQQARERRGVAPGATAPLPQRAPAPPGARTARHRVQPNAATAAQARVDAAVAARDFGAIRAAFSDELHEIDHPTGSSYGPDECVASVERLFRSRDPFYRIDPIATLGPSLFLGRRRSGASGAAGARYDVGAYEDEKIQLLEVDGRGLFERSEVFGADHLYAAVARLYERHGELLPPGPERDQASAIARSLSSGFAGSDDFDTFAGTLAPAIEMADHRLVGFETTRGVEAALAAVRSLHDLAEDFRVRFDDLLALSRDQLLVRATTSGTARDGGGAFERHICPLFRYDADGRITHWEVFDPDHEADALARFDELAGSQTPLDEQGRLARRAVHDAEQVTEALARFEKIVGTADSAPAPTRFANAATRAVERVAAAHRARDWEGVAALFATDFRSFDRRALVQLEADREQWLASYRQIVDMSAPPTYEVLATRGDRLTVVRWLWQGAEGDIGPSEIESLLVIEVDERGDHLVVVTFDPDNLDAAYAELDVRYGSDPGEGHTLAYLQEWRAAVDRRDWVALVALCAPDLVCHDHRLVGFGTFHGGAQLVASQRAMVDLAPDAWLRVDHLIAAGRGVFSESVWTGTRDSGAFESPAICVMEVDPHGQARRLDFYDSQHFEQASARFDELAASAGTAVPAPHPTLAEPNAASTGLHGWTAAFDIGVATDNWDAMRRLCAPGMVFEDRRRLALLSGDVELMIASARERAVSGARPEAVCIGTGGERVGVWRMLWSGGPADGRFEIEYLALIEVDAAGLVTAIILIDLDDPRAAQREMWARWVAIDPAMAPLVAVMSEATDAFVARDRGRVRALYADDHVVEDHRHAGLGRIEGGDAYAHSIAVLWDLASVMKFEWGWVIPAVRPDGAVTVIRRFGTLTDGGAFESEYLSMFLCERGRITHTEMFELDALDAALARFEALRPGPLTRIARPNAASAWLDRLHVLLDAKDWDAMHAAIGPEATYEDRQRGVLLSGDADMIRSSLRERLDAGARPERLELLGTAGSRVAIHRVLWAGGGPDSRFEIKFLIVQEVDEAGRLAATINFDLDDTRAAQREAWARWAAIDPVAKPWVDFLSTLADAYNGRDLTVRHMGAKNVVVDDRRRTGFGQIHGRDAYFEAATALWDLAPDTRIEFGWYWPACDRHAAVATMRRSGTLAGGGAFESDDLVLLVLTSGVLTRIEFFELEALDTALARFEELRPDPLRIPPNGATRAFDRWYEAVRSANLGAVDALHDASLVLDDRRRLVRVTTGADAELTHARFLLEGGWRPTRTLLATAGDRLALQQIVWTTGEAGASSEVEILELDEVNREGRFVRIVLFDPDDRAAASAELFERWVATDAEGIPAALVEYMRAWNDHDLDRLRAVMPADYYFHDHRRTGIGRVEAEAHIASLAALYELSPDVRLEILNQIAMAKHGALFLARWFGTNAEGGEFESVFLTLTLDRHAQPVGFEIFEIDDLDTARARFARSA